MNVLNVLKVLVVVENGMSGDLNGSLDSGCVENSIMNGGRKCSFLIIDEFNEIKFRCFVRRDSYLFNNIIMIFNGDVGIVNSRLSYVM